MATELDIDDGWTDQLTPSINSTVMRATTAVRDDSKAGCPVDTGDLKASLTALNSAPMQGRVVSHMPYCAAVELGFHGMEYVHPYMREGHPVKGFTRRGNTPAQPFLRPALWRTRNLAA